MKRKLILLAVMAVAFCGNAFAADESRIVTDSLKSEILGCYVKYNVYLPVDYDRSNEVYPVVYLLHGLTDNYEAWKVRGGMKTVANELIETGEASRMIIIMPNAGDADHHNIYNGYFNMPGWNYEDFFFQEFIPQVEARYQIISDRWHRAIMGLSMGGGGSIVYCQRHPETFSSCYALSPWLDEPRFNPEKGPKDKFYYTCKAVREHSALDFLRNADEKTIKELNTVRWFTDCGDDDYLFKLSIEFHCLMKEAGINSELRVRNGKHNWEYWHLGLRTALPFASRNFR